VVEYRVYSQVAGIGTPHKEAAAGEGRPRR
jgi:hypothetical protein